jgi:glycerol-3-phosphate dehydrogenase (NAD(P)+)
MNITVLGGGAWGTAIALSAARHHAPHSVCLWARDPQQIQALQIHAENKQYLPGISLPKELLLEADFQKLWADCAQATYWLLPHQCLGYPKS